MKNSKLLIVLLSVLLCVACSDNSEKGKVREIEARQNYCTADTSKDRAEFILQCLKNANPKSDEEPEDWIYQCKEMAEDTLCPMTEVIIKEECVSTRDFSSKCSWWSARTISVTPKDT